MGNLKNKTQAGFSILELITAMAAVIILGATALALNENYIKESKTSEAFRFLGKIAESQITYYERHGTFLELEPVNIPPGVAKQNANFAVGNWLDLGFASASPQVQFGYRAYFSGSRLIIEALGDQDGDGDLALFSVVVDPPDGTNQIRRGEIVTMDRIE